MVAGDRELDPAALLIVGLFVALAGLVQTIVALRMRRRFQSRPDREVEIDDIIANAGPEPPPRDPRGPDAENPDRWFMILVFGALFTAGGAAVVIKALSDLLR